MPMAVRQEVAIPLDWRKCEGDAWCSLLRLNLDHPHFDGLDGVYIIWHGGPEPRTVYVGKGSVRDRLAAHRRDQRVLQYSPRGLLATWAAVEPHSRSGIERYLADTLDPLVGDRLPDAAPIPVTFPW